MPAIESITCHKELNSRGEWTIETHVTLEDGSKGIQAIPSGASKGENEAVYIPVEKAIDIVSSAINDALHGEEGFDQRRIDAILIEMDGTPNKKHLGGNSILSVSLATARACAVHKQVQLYEYLAELYGQNIENLEFPTPVFNVINGGKHAHNNLSFQEFMVIPAQKTPFDKAVEMGVDIYKTLEKTLEKHNFETGVGDEGGFAPTGFTAPMALQFMRNTAKKKYEVGDEVFFGMDVAAGSFKTLFGYDIKEESLLLSGKQLGEYYSKLISDFEIMYLEDGFFENDHNSWQEFTAEWKDRLLIVADDLVVTNAKFLKKAIDKNLANAVIIKPNQVGTLTETFDFIKMAKDAGLTTIVSHRSGDIAEDTFIADLALAVKADFIKSGAPARGERVVKYNRLLEIYYDTQTLH